MLDSAPRPAPAPLPCPDCSGTGRAGITSERSGEARLAEWSCSECHGDGYLTCDACCEPATVRDGHGVWCEACARADAIAADVDVDVMADTVPCPAPFACEAAS